MNVTFSKLLISAVVFTGLLFGQAAHAAVTTVALYRLGENDASPSNGGAGNNPTVAGVGSVNLSPANGPVYSTDTPGAASQFSMAFNGTNGQLYSSASSVSTATQDWGIEAWVKTASFKVAYIAHDGNLTGWGIRQNNGVIQGHLPMVGYFGSANVTLNEWQHLALVSEGNNITLYLNGVNAGATTSGVPLTPVNGFMIGGQLFNGNENFNGLIDHVRVFTFSPGQFNAATDLSLNMAIPEPSGFALAGFALMGIFGAARRRLAAN